MERLRDGELGRGHDGNGKKPNLDFKRSSLAYCGDPALYEQVQRLHLLSVYGRWALVSLAWLTIGSLSLWGLRYPIALLAEYFTWAALRYGLFYNFLPTLGLSLCIGMTVSVLVWQSRNILFGIPAVERCRLERHVYEIRQQGRNHFLWRWVCRPGS